MSAYSIVNVPLLGAITDCRSLLIGCYSYNSIYFPSIPPTKQRISSARTLVKATGTAMETNQTGTDAVNTSSSREAMKLLFVEMGVGYDQHGQDITAAAMRACRDAISSNSIPAFRRGSIPGVTFEQMKLQIKLGVPHSLQHSLDMERVKSVFPYGKIVNVEVVDGGLICSSGVLVEDMGDKNDDCYIVNAAVYVGYWLLFPKFPFSLRISWHLVELAMKLMKNVSAELIAVGDCSKEVDLIVQRD